MDHHAGSVEQALSSGDVHELLRVWEDWHVIQSAREAGATWAQIGEALGISKQAAHDVYRRKIEEQQRHLPDLTCCFAL